jgi:thiamine-phosphate pyrophosphorylase
MAKTKNKKKTSSDSHLETATQACRLYLITPSNLPDLTQFATLLDQTLAAGDVAALQLRLKDVDDDTIRRAVEVLRPVAHQHDVALVLNDRPDLALELECDGVHVGQGDTPYAEARAIMGPDAFVGVTCHDSRHLGMIAAEAGADYIAFGAFYPTETKETEFEAGLDLLDWWQQMMTAPCVAIGGITVDNAAPLIDAGADFIAVCGGVWNHPQGPAEAVRAFNALLTGEHD